MRAYARTRRNRAWHGCRLSSGPQHRVDAFAINLVVIWDEPWNHQRGSAEVSPILAERAIERRPVQSSRWQTLVAAVTAAATATVLLILRLNVWKCVSNTRNVADMNSEAVLGRFKEILMLSCATYRKSILLILPCSRLRLRSFSSTKLN